MKTSQKLVKATDNKGVFMQMTETVGQDKIMATRAQGIQGYTVTPMLDQFPKINS